MRFFVKLSLSTFCRSAKEAGKTKSRFDSKFRSVSESFNQAMSSFKAGTEQPLSQSVLMFLSDTVKRGGSVK